MLDRQRIRTFLLGGVVGALAGLLLAPRSGRELRGTLADRAGEARERGRETYFEAQERMRERFSETRESGTYQTGAWDQEAAGSGPAGMPAEPGQTSLRDVSRGSSEESAEPEALRERIRATRARLRARLEDAGGAGEEQGNDDGG